MLQKLGHSFRIFWQEHQIGQFHLSISSIRFIESSSESGAFFSLRKFSVPIRCFLVKVWKYMSTIRHAESIYIYIYITCLSTTILSSWLNIEDAGGRSDPRNLVVYTKRRNEWLSMPTGSDFFVFHRCLLDLHRNLFSRYEPLQSKRRPVSSDRLE